MCACIYHPSEIMMSMSYNELQKMVAIFKEFCTNFKSITIIDSVSASRAEDREFASRPGHTKDHHKNGTNYLPA